MRCCCFRFIQPATPIKTNCQGCMKEMLLDFSQESSADSPSDRHQSPLGVQNDGCMRHRIWFEVPRSPSDSLHATASAREQRRAPVNFDDVLVFSNASCLVVPMLV